MKNVVKITMGVKEFKIPKKVIIAETFSSTFIINLSNFGLFVFSTFLHAVEFISLFTSIYIYIYIVFTDCCSKIVLRTKKESFIYIYIYIYIYI